MAINNNRAKKLSGINTLAYLGVEPTTASLLIVSNERGPTTDDRAGNQIGAVWIWAETASHTPAEIWYLVRLQGSGPSGTATWLQVAAGGGMYASLFNADVGSAIPAANILNVIGGATAPNATINMNTFASGNTISVALNNSIYQPDTIADGTNGLYALGVTGFLHNYGAGGGTDGNTFVGGDAGGPIGAYTLTGTNITCVGYNSFINAGTNPNVTCLGSQTFANMTEGAASTVIGAFAGENADQSSSLVLIGYQAGRNINSTPVGTGGTRSIAIGAQALSVGDLTGIENIMIGFQSGENMTTSEYCIGIGSRSQDEMLTGARNISLGTDSLGAETSGSDNVAIGHNALLVQNGSSDNIAIGSGAGDAISTGIENVAIGSDSLGALTTGSTNTCIGYNTMASTPGNSGSNTAIGWSAMGAGTAHSSAIGIGYNALGTSGSLNTSVAIGFRVMETAANITTASVVIGTRAGQVLDTGTNIVAIGHEALQDATTGHNGTTAIGYQALRSCTTQAGVNTAVGYQALSTLTTGTNNIALGNSAGSALTTTDSDNICIGNVGVAGDAGEIRIGTNGTHVKAWFAGIRGVTTGVADAVPVLVDSADQLGVTSSSRRFKENIRDMADDSHGLMKLRPVTFTYKTDTDKKLQYGLIAEEVDEHMPRLVVHDKEGDIFSVKYHEMPSLLLNELQKLAKRVKQLEDGCCSKCGNHVE